MTTTTTEIDTIRGTVPVRLALVTRGAVRAYLVSWRSPYGPLALALKTEATARAVAARLAAGQAPETALTAVLHARKQFKVGASGGRAAWKATTPEERSAELKRRALKRWATVRAKAAEAEAAPVQTIEGGSHE